MPDKIDVDRVKTIEELFQENGLPSPQKGYKKLLSSSAIGDIERSLTNLFQGINHRQNPGVLSINRDTPGLVLFSRPLLNLTDGNLANNRDLVTLLNPDRNSYARVMRVMLDDRLPGYGIDTDLFPNDCAFMPILTNTLITMSGWPDMAVPTHTSDSGLFKEDISWVDGQNKVRYSFDITCNFQNIEGDPISALFQAWTTYSTLVFMGGISPRPEFITRRRVDYTTGIWRLILDESKTTIIKIARSGLGAFPLNVRTGASFDYDANSPVNTNNNEISQSFKVIGADYNDPILFKEFNDLIYYFNDGMMDATREKLYIKIPMAVISMFNFKGTPHINLKTKELEWWVDRETWNYVIGADRQTG